jgi:hypothetical protein
MQNSDLTIGTETKFPNYYWDWINEDHGAAMKLQESKHLLNLRTLYRYVDIVGEYDDENQY